MGTVSWCGLGAQAFGSPLVCTPVEVQVPRPLPQRAPSLEPEPLASGHHIFRLWPPLRWQSGQGRSAPTAGRE